MHHHAVASSRLISSGRATIIGQFLAAWVDHPAWAFFVELLVSRGMRSMFEVGRSAWSPVQEKAHTSLWDHGSLLCRGPVRCSMAEPCRHVLWCFLYTTAWANLSLAPRVAAGPAETQGSCHRWGSGEVGRGTGVSLDWHIAHLYVRFCLLTQAGVVSPLLRRACSLQRGRHVLRCLLLPQVFGSARQVSTRQ